MSEAIITIMGRSSSEQHAHNNNDTKKFAVTIATSNMTTTTKTYIGNRMSLKLDDTICCTTFYNGARGLLFREKKLFFATAPSPSRDKNSDWSVGRLVTKHKISVAVRNAIVPYCLLHLIDTNIMTMYKMCT